MIPNQGILLKIIIVQKPFPQLIPKILIVILVRHRNKTFIAIRYHILMLPTNLLYLSLIQYRLRIHIIIINPNWKIRLLIDIQLRQLNLNIRIWNGIKVLLNGTIKQLLDQLMQFFHQPYHRIVMMLLVPFQQLFVKSVVN